MKIEEQIVWCKAQKKASSDKDYQSVMASVIRSLQKLQKESITLKRYQEFVSIYNEFCKRELGAPARMDSVNGSALKKIVDYLLKQERVNGSEENALAAWAFILAEENWSKLNDFLRGQVKLVQMNKYIEEILFKFRNVSKAESKSTKQDQVEHLESLLRGEG